MAKFPIKSWTIGFIAGLNNPQLFGILDNGTAPPLPAGYLSMDEANRSAMLQGYLMGRRVASFNIRAIIGYLYNGKLLPAIPDDTSVYSEFKYKFIAKTVFKYYVSSTKIPLIKTKNSMKTADGSNFEIRMCSFSDNYGNVKETEYSSSYVNSTIDELVWSNYDILNEDGTVYFAASEPVPVYNER